MTGADTVASTLAYTSLAEVAAQVARGLAKADLAQGRAFIRTPVLLPSGSTVVVVIEDMGGGRYHLSDLGQGFEEADRLGVLRVWRGQAADVAALSGVAFTGTAFTLADATLGQLTGGTMTLANAVARAAERTLLRTAQTPRETGAERLIERLGQLFPHARIARSAELRGASEHAWSVDAAVIAGDRRAVFDIVTPSPVSVAFASTKFHDIALLDDAPIRVAVVHRKASFGNLLSVVAQAARVVENDAPDRAFIRAAELLTA